MVRGKDESGGCSDRYCFVVASITVFPGDHMVVPMFVLLVRVGGVVFDLKLLVGNSQPSQACGA